MEFFREEGYTPSTKILIFDRKQLTALLICTLLSAGALYYASKADKFSALCLLRVLSSVNLAFILLRLSNYIFILKNFHADYSLPLHLCSFNVLLCFAAAWSLRPFLLDFVYAISPVAAAFALICPESDAARYPRFNFRCLEYYYSHTCLILTPLIPVLFLDFTPSLAYFPACMALLGGMLLLAGGVNALTGGNYMFLSYGPSGTPLSFLEKKLGKLLYRGILIALFVCLYLLMHLFA